MGIDDHQLDEDGYHDEEECEVCYEQEHAHCGSCGCGRCCESLIVEASLRDAEREPKIAQLGRPIKDNFAPDEIVGYMLTDVRRGCCKFFDQTSRKCTIYETRPLGCRVFNCDEWRQDNPPPPVSTLTEADRQERRERLQTLVAAAHRCAAAMSEDDARKVGRSVAAAITEQFSGGHLSRDEWWELIDALWDEDSRSQPTRPTTSLG